MRGDTYQVLEIGSTPQRRVSFVVQSAMSTALGLVEHVFSVSASPSLHTEGGGDIVIARLVRWWRVFMSVPSWEGCIV